MMTKKMIIPGGSGFLGQYVARYFVPKGYEVIILSRQVEQSAVAGIRYVLWDGRTMAGDWAACLEGAEVVLNLAGRTVNCRYTEENKRQILASRLESTRVLGEAIGRCTVPPKVWMNSSSATIYADTRGDAPANDEWAHRIGDDFSMNVCKAWEKEMEAAVCPQTRKLILRTAITLGKEGGAAVPMVRLTRLYLGGTQGGGDQYVSWLHVEDFARMVAFLLERDDLSGIFNCAAPHPVTNRVFMGLLRKACGRGWGLPTAEWMLRLGAAWIMKTEVELVLKSRKVVSKRFEQAGFVFKYADLGAALQEVTGGGK